MAAPTSSPSPTYDSTTDPAGYTSYTSINQAGTDTNGENTACSSDFSELSSPMPLNAIHHQPGAVQHLTASDSPHAESRSVVGIVRIYAIVTLQRLWKTTNYSGPSHVIGVMLLALRIFSLERLLNYVKL